MFNLLIKLFLPNAWKFTLKHLNCVIFTVCVIFVFGLGYKISDQGDKIRVLAEEAQEANEIASQRKAVIDELRQDMKAQQKAIAEQMEKEHQLREQSNEQINAISTMLKNNQCASTDVPVDVRRELHNATSKGKR